MKPNMKSGALIAAAAASMALSGAAFAEPASVGAGDTVKCAGVNSCKGQGTCKTVENACKGQNACKGHGFLPEKASECFTKGGKIIGYAKNGKIFDLEGK
jgi:hypothetical protein